MLKWKNIEGFEGNYSVSENGDIRNNKTGKILKSWINKHSGYMQVTLYGPKIRRTVHSLVAEAFCDKPDIIGKLSVDHIDCDKLNNKASNLEFVSYSENISRAYSNGLRKNQKGISKPRKHIRYYSDDEKTEWIEAYLNDVSISNIAKYSGANKMTVYREVNKFKELETA